MKIKILYLTDENGKVKAVQIPVDDWKKVLTKHRKYDQSPENPVGSQGGL